MCGGGRLMRWGGALTVWSVSVPGPHSHPAAVERGGKDINRRGGLGPTRRSDQGGFAARWAHNGTVA